VAVLTFPGDPALDSEDNTSPSFASEIDWEERLYGTYRTRLELARCDAGEEVVNGIFTYSHGGDSNDNGITDNNEIDIEILCGEPYVIFLSSWTDYDDDNSFRKWSRAIDTRSGDYRESPSATEYGLGPVLGNIPGANVPGFPEGGRFYEMGFEWQPDRIRWFIVFDSEEVTLWDFSDASLIAQNPASFLFNVWHAPSHWFEGGAADYPANDAVMRIDWFRYWAYQ
jgi:beta-glucanase (GH16 family)